MRPSYYPGNNQVPPSPSQQMATFRTVNPAQGNAAQASSLVRPSYLQVDVSPYMGIPGPHLASPSGYVPSPSPSHPFVMQRFPYSAQNSPASGNRQLGMVGGPRPPPVFTGSNEAAIHDQALRSLQERVAQIASIPRPTVQEVANYASQHITPKNIGPDGNHILLQEVTHLNPPGGARAPYLSNHKLTHASSSASLSELFQGRLTPSDRSTSMRLSQPGTPSGQPASMLITMPPPPLRAASSPSSQSAVVAAAAAAARFIGPTEEELRKLNELMPTGDDADSRKTVEEWKRFRLRVMSRLRKQRWRAKKKAEVLAGVEDTQREEAERKRRDRLRKQEQRAKKKQRAIEDGSQLPQDSPNSSVSEVQTTNQEGEEGSSSN